MDSLIDIINKGRSDHTLSLSDKNLILKMIVIIAIIIFGFTFLFPTNYAFVITLLIFTGYVVNMYLSYTSESISSKNKEIMYHLEVLQDIVNSYINKKINSQTASTSKLSDKEINTIYNNNQLTSMYIDSNLIQFLYSIRNINEWDDSEFYLLLKGTNNILKLRKEIEEYYAANKSYPENIYEMMETTLILRTNTINNMHRFIYNVPKTHMMYNYINKIIERYMVLISRNTDKIYYYLKDHIKVTGVNNRTKFITYNTIRPHEPDFYQENIKQKSSQIIDYYT